MNLRESVVPGTFVGPPMSAHGFERLGGFGAVVV